MEKNKSKQLDAKLQGIMEYYVKQFFDSGYREECKNELSKHNPGFIDPEMLDIQIDQYIDMIASEAADKFHSITSLILSLVASGKEPLVREFEVLFIDLVKRTLVKEKEKEKEALQPISIIIEDPNVAGSEES